MPKEGFPPQDHNYDNFDFNTCFEQIKAHIAEKTPIPVELARATIQKIKGEEGEQQAQMDEVMRTLKQNDVLFIKDGHTITLAELTEKASEKTKKALSAEKPVTQNQPVAKPKEGKKKTTTMNLNDLKAPNNALDQMVEDGTIRTTSEENKISEQELNTKESQLENLARSSKKQIPYALVDELWTVYNATNQDAAAQASIERRKTKFLEIVSKKGVKIIQANKREITWNDFLIDDTEKGREAKTLIKNLKDAIDDEKPVPVQTIRTLYETLGSGNDALVSKLLKDQILKDFQVATRKKGISIVLANGSTEKAGAEIFMTPASLFILGRPLAQGINLKEMVSDGKGNLVQKEAEEPTVFGQIAPQVTIDGSGKIVPHTTEEQTKFGHIAPQVQIDEDGKIIPYTAEEEIRFGHVAPLVRINDRGEVEEYTNEEEVVFGQVAPRVIMDKDHNILPAPEDVENRVIDPTEFRRQLETELEHIDAHIIDSILHEITDELKHLSNNDQQKLKEIYEGLMPQHHEEHGGHDEHEGHGEHGEHAGDHHEATPENMGQLITALLAKLESSETFEMSETVRTSLKNKLNNLITEMKKVEISSLTEEKLFKDDKENLHIFKGLNKMKYKTDEESLKKITEIESKLNGAKDVETIDDTYRILLLKEKFAEILEYNISMRKILGEEIKELRRILEEKERELEEKRRILSEAKSQMDVANANGDKNEILSATEAYKKALDEFNKLEGWIEILKMKINAKVEKLAQVTAKIEHIEEHQTEMENSTDLSEATRLVEDAEKNSKEIKEIFHPTAHGHDHGHDHHTQKVPLWNRIKHWSLIGGGLLSGLFVLFAQNLYDTIRDKKGGGGGGGHGGGDHKGGHGGGHH